jgi:RNA polymerase sigma-70 factor (TIGR02943 family)
MIKSEAVVIIQGWVEAFSDKLYSWALYKTSSQETAEDLVQDTFLAACQSFEKFEGRSDSQTWLFGILNNKIADHFRKVYRNPTSNKEVNSESNFFKNFFDEGGDWLEKERPQAWENEEANLLNDTEFVKILQACLKELPDNWYAAINLKFLEQKKGEIICQELQITPTNFWQILHRAKLQLRKCLQLNWFKK